MRNFNLNIAGFVIVGLFVVTWIAALAIWRYGRIEERWGASLQQPATPERAEIG
jgi:high-affinity nickel-transport protein